MHQLQDHTACTHISCTHPTLMDMQLLAALEGGLVIDQIAVDFAAF